MLQTGIWRNVQARPPKVGPAAWWQRHRVVLAPQLILVLGVLALLGGAFLAIDQYSRQRAEVRLAETNRFLEEFRSGRVGAAAARVRAAWQAEAARQEFLLARLARTAGTDAARRRREHQEFVLETIEEYGLAPDIEVVRRFVATLAACVRVDSCDRDTTAAQLGPALRAFRDQHWYYFQFEYSGIDLDRHLETIAPRLARAAPEGAVSR